MKPLHWLRAEPWRMICAITLILMLLTAFMPLRVVRYPNDGLTTLEGAWRMHQGMRIYRDWHAPLGPLYFLMLQGAMTVTGLSHRAFALTAGLFLPVIVAASWL